MSVFLVKNNESAITISIVTHNSDKIFMSLDTLLKSLTNTTIKIKIFDNASETSYQAKLRVYLKNPAIEINFYPENRGFGFGHNQNLMKQTGYGIIFNPDIILEENHIVDLINLLQAHPECALLAPKILNQDGTTQHLVRERLDVFDYLLRFVPFKVVKKVFQKRLARFECQALPEDRDTYVKMISGSFMVADLEKFQAVAGFDERYFMYFEDNDLCQKMAQADYKILYTPRYSVIHLYERGAVKNKKLFKIFLQSMGKYFNKWGWNFF